MGCVRSAQIALPRPIRISAALKRRRSGPVAVAPGLLPGTMPVHPSGAMEVHQLTTFLAVIDHGGFSRAAEALGIGQSTVSFHVKALEQAVDARLLDRRGRQV